MYSDNNLILVYYQCTRLLEDGTCDSDHVHLDITMKDTRHMQPHQLLWFKVLARQLCLDIDDMQTVSHDGTSNHCMTSSRNNVCSSVQLLFMLDYVW